MQFGDSLRSYVGTTIRYRENPRAKPRTLEVAGLDPTRKDEALLVREPWQFGQGEARPLVVRTRAGDMLGEIEVTHRPAGRARRHAC